MHPPFRSLDSPRSNHKIRADKKVWEAFDGSRALHWEAFGFQTASHLPLGRTHGSLRSSVSQPVLPGREPRQLTRGRIFLF